jgi:hypothetical protein
VCKEKKKKWKPSNKRKGKSKGKEEAQAGGRQNKALSVDDEERIIGTKCGGWVKGKVE